MVSEGLGVVEHIERIWRVSDRKDGLGLHCAEGGLFLGATPLLQCSADAFVPRPQDDLEALLSRGFGFPVSLEQVMSGLSAVASALTAGDLCRARIAAVHLRIPDLPDHFARLDMQLGDVALKLDRIAKTTAAGDWNPANSSGWDPDEHPRAGTAPNPGWFATTSGNGDSGVRPTLVSDKPDDDGRLHLPPGERNDEIGDLLEWIANAKREDIDGINSEISRLFSQVGDFQNAAALHHALATVLAHPDDATRQKVLDEYEPITHRDDPSKGADLITDLATNALLGPASRFLKPGAEAAATAEGAATAEVTAAGTASGFWKLGWAARGQKIEEAITADMHGVRTGPSYPVIDFLGEDGAATSIKSIDLNAGTYQDAGRLSYRVSTYVRKLADFDGASYGETNISSKDIQSRVLNVVIPKGSMTAAQKSALDAVAARAKNAGVTLKIIPF